MNTVLSDSMARDHVATIEATAAASRRAREAGLARRSRRRSNRTSVSTSNDGSRRDGSTSRVAHAAARPFTAVHDWLVAGQL